MWKSLDCYVWVVLWSEKDRRYRLELRLKLGTIIEANLCARAKRGEKREGVDLWWYLVCLLYGMTTRVYTCIADYDSFDAHTHTHSLSLRIREKVMLRDPKKTLFFLSFSADPCHGSELMFHLRYEEVDLRRSRYSQRIEWTDIHSFISSSLSAPLWTCWRSLVVFFFLNFGRCQVLMDLSLYLSNENKYR